MADADTDPTVRPHPTTAQEPTLVKILVVIHLPLFREAGTLSNLRKIVELDAVPRVGDMITLPGNRILPIGQVMFRADGHVSVHINDYAQILDFTTVGGPLGIADLAEEFRLDGYTGITEWDQD